MRSRGGGVGEEEGGGEEEEEKAKQSFNETSPLKYLDVLIWVGWKRDTDRIERQRGRDRRRDQGVGEGGGCFV